MNHSKTSNKDTKQEDMTKPTEEIKALETENMTLKEQLRIKDQQIEEMLKNHSQSLLLKESSNRQFEIYSNELENKISNITRERDNLQFQYNNNHAELQQYKQLCEKLKCKIKELSAANAKDKGKDNNFFDTFEEVMQEEMFTMKMAFEAKLKAARDESEALSKKHQQEIQRLQASSSPFTAGKR
jgi:chromosome segregation ATPase